ncbi:MAG: thioredoxin family protein [candidate division Zixibacteria bacterium]|nr:thioredoxin family protein [candidate division Zixibacteria bacterium]
MKFVKMTMVVMFALMLLTACGTKQEADLSTAPHFTNYEEARTEAARTNKPMLVSYWGDWCSWCKKLDTVVFMDPKGIEFFTNQAILVKINAGVDSLLKKEQQVSALPTSILFDKDGVEIDRIIGFMEVDDFLKTVTDYQNGIGTLADLLNRVGTEADRSLYMEIAEKYKYRDGSDDAGTWYQKVIDEGDRTDSLSGECRMSLADMKRRAEEYDAAIVGFNGVINDYEGQMFAQDAHIWIAIVHRQKGDTAVAIEAFENYIKKFPESEDIKYAQGQIDKLNGI